MRSKNPIWVFLSIIALIAAAAAIVIAFMRRAKLSSGEHDEIIYTDSDDDFADYDSCDCDCDDCENEASEDEIDNEEDSKE